MNNQILRAQLPSFFGKGNEDDESHAVVEPGTAATPKEAKKFIAPGQFYGKKNRVSAEPLFVFLVLRVVSLAEFGNPVTILMLLEP